MINVPLISAWKSNPSAYDPYLLTTLYDVIIEVGAMDQALKEVVRSSALLKPSQMTRIERSFASQRVPGLAKDSTSPIFGFLKAIQDLTSKLAVSGSSPQYTMGIPKDVRHIQRTHDS